MHTNEKRLREAHRDYLEKKFPDLTGWKLEYSTTWAVKSKHPSGLMVRTTNYDGTRHVIGGGKAVKRSPGDTRTPDWEYPPGTPMPRPKPVVPAGSEVLFFGGARRGFGGASANSGDHHNHRCEVLDSWCKIAGATPKVYVKYKLRCIEPQCDGAKTISAEIGRGVQVVALPVTVEAINNMRNVEVRRHLIERYGQAEYLHDGGGELVSQDPWGKLWRLEQGNDEALVLVEMLNSTPEPDGSYKTYFERVPPFMRTPLEALAWQAQLDPVEYALITTQT